MFIQTATTPNEDALKFLPSQNVLGTNNTVEFISGREAHSSPLARKLFAVDGVRSIMFGSDFITVEKNAD
jgi:NFU1 iron-sulfur cluster scaffold homolog, mitochondrial